MVPSNYQTAIYDAVKSKSHDILVKATAGSGKTTTIVTASSLIPMHKNTIFLAFNKSIVEELKTRLSKNVECKTLHSLGYSGLFRFYKNSGFKLNDFKTTNFLDRHLKKSLISPKDRPKAQWAISDLLSFARLNIIPNENQELNDIADYYNILIDDKELELARMTYNDLMEYNDIRFQNDKKIIDFNDMIYLPAIYEMVLPKYDVVFVDEAQDLNKCQQKLVEKIKKPNGRAIYVGDDNQAIYRFAGADGNSFGSLVNDLTITLPLSVCYRCSKNIIKEAQKIIGEENIKWAEGQEDGLVTYGNWEMIKEGDMVVCRNNSPLFSLYFDLLGKGIKANIRGKEIEKKLMLFVEKVRYSSVGEGLNTLNLLLEKMEEKLLNKGYSKPENSKQFQTLSEVIRIIGFLGEDKEMMSEVKAELTEIFHEDKDAAILMTIHKAKGLENDTVHFLSPELIPSKWSETDEELKQEENLRFVATTRAKKHLNYIYNYTTRIHE